MSSPRGLETNGTEDLSRLSSNKFVPRCPVESSEDSESSSSSEDESSDSDSSVSILSSSPDHCPKIQSLKTKGELTIEDLPPIQNLEISVPEEECQVIGHIFNSVDTLVLVKAIPNLPAVDLESVLFLDKGDCVLGQVFDVIGPVTEPIYCIRFNSKEYISELSFNVGDPVYYTPALNYTNYVFLPDLLKMKGSDASWEHENEPPEEELDYSDDAQERAAKRNRKLQKRKWKSTLDNKCQNSNESSSQNGTPVTGQRGNRNSRKSSAQKDTSNQQQTQSKTLQSKHKLSELNHSNNSNLLPQNGKQNQSQTKSSDSPQSCSSSGRNPFSSVEPSTFQNSEGISINPANLRHGFPNPPNNLVNSPLNFSGNLVNVTNNSIGLPTSRPNFTVNPPNLTSNFVKPPSNSATFPCNPVNLPNNPASFLPPDVSKLPINLGNNPVNFSLPDVSKPPPLLQMPPANGVGRGLPITGVNPDSFQPPPGFPVFPSKPPSFGQPPPFPFSPLARPLPPGTGATAFPGMPNERPNAPW